MDDFLIKLQAILDGEKSKENINKSIDRMQHKLDKLKLQATLDPKAAQNLADEIGKLINQKIVISNIEVETNQTNKAGQQIGTNIAQNVAKGINQSSNKVDSEVQKLADRVNDIKRSIDNGYGASAYQNQINGLINDFQKYGVTVESAKTQTSSLQQIFDNMKGLSGQELVAQVDKFEQEFKAVKISVDQAKLSYDKFMQPVANEKTTSLINRINTFLTKNTNITKDARAELQGYVDELTKGVNLRKWNEINGKLKETENSMRGLKRLGASLKDQMSQAAQSFTQWLSVSSAVMLLINQLRKMPKAVYEIDTAMTNLYKVTDETDKKYTQFLDSASVSARKLGRSVSSLVEQTANWAKLGFYIDEASKLAEISSIYANVGEVDDDTAVSDIVTAMKAFNIKAENSITIVDSLNKLGNEFATDAKSLGEGLRNAASSMAVAGNDINQTLAILTGGGEITQNVAELSNGLRVVTMRLRGMKGALQEIGEEYEDIESISKIQTQIYDLTKGSVNIFKDDGSFKSTYDQLKEISEIYFDLNDSDKTDLTEILFGKNRANQGIAILQAFKSGQIQKAYEASINSAGSAYEEQNKWMESLEAKTQQFEAAFQSLSNTIVDSDMLKDIVDLGTKGVSSLEGIAKALEYINSLGGITNSTGGLLGSVSGLLMNKIGIGERTMFQW